MSEKGEDWLAAARYGDKEDLKAFVDEDPSIVNYADEFGSTALHKAAGNGHEECIEFLLSKGAKLLRNDSGNTALSWAVLNGNVKVVKMLVEAFPEVNMLEENSSGQSIVTECLQNGNDDIIAIILKHPSVEAASKAAQEAAASPAEEADDKEEKTEEMPKEG
ncbi:unnamed protein product [Symbiodinium sp. KB8]|nr:unnamed protein product [Symbiodinium sp. KB8]